MAKTQIAQLVALVGTLTRNALVYSAPQAAASVATVTIVVVLVALTWAATEAILAWRLGE